MSSRSDTYFDEGETVYINHWTEAMRNITSRNTRGKTLDFFDFLAFISACETEEQCEAVKQVWLSNMRGHKAGIKRRREELGLSEDEYVLKVKKDKEVTVQTATKEEEE